ncbi:C40 family peptidase [Micromonospora sp. NPDC000207]|uniref:C40 family peptidase n=1 Tax=Micromonospora sp. NPDC000207 TaxID=3154246 RepID=UPI00331D0567
MVDSGHGRRRTRRRPVISPVLRPRLWAALLGAVASAILSAPAYADPPLPSTVPDSGSRPIAAGGLQIPGDPAQPGVPTLPGGGAPTTVPTNLTAGPLGTQIALAETQLGLVSDQVLGLGQKRTETEARLATAKQNLELARQALTTAQLKADQAAADTLKAAAALPPGEFGQDLHHLSQLQRISRGDKAPGATTSTGGELTRARAAEQAAVQELNSAELAALNARGEYTVLDKTRRDQETKLLKLRRDNSEQLVRIERQRDAAEEQLGAGYVNGGSSQGLTAHPRALAAVRYAMAQRGDPYKWATQGPDTFDCSGLVWAAYRSKGADYFGLPRVARDQYRHTSGRTVPRTALLPGDLVFFANGSSWQSIHHMGMYIGDGKMVHAPTTGDVVKVSPVGWSRLYAATRVVGAVPETKPPATTPPAAKPTPTPSATPKPTPKPSTSPKPLPTNPTPGPTTPTPGPTTPTPGPTTPKPSPTPTTPPPSPTTGPPASESPDPTPSGSPSPSAETSGAAGGTPRPSDSAHPVD